MGAFVVRVQAIFGNDVYYLRSRFDSQSVCVEFQSSLFDVFLSKNIIRRMMHDTHCGTSV